MKRKTKMQESNTKIKVFSKESQIIHKAAPLLTFKKERNAKHK